MIDSLCSKDNDKLGGEKAWRGTEGNLTVSYLILALW